jgi:hypothetical protein
VGLDDLADRLLRLRDDARLPVFGQLRDLGGQPDQPAAGGDQLVERRALGVVGGLGLGGEGFAEPGDHLGIDRIVFGQATGRFGKIAHPLGVDDAHRDPGLAQRLGPAALVAAAGFHHRQRDRVGAQPGDQRRFALRRARLAPPLL